MAKLPSGPFDIVYADPPWNYYGSKTKMAAAGKHYDLMTMNELVELGVPEIMSPKSALFLWATCPRLDFAMRLIKAWDLNYRGVAYVWVKTRKDGTPMGARGVMPTFTKPIVELVLVATTVKTGRPFPIHDLKQPQTVFAPVGAHSEKPQEVRARIETLCGDLPRIELFARGMSKGWTVWGNQAIRAKGKMK